MSAIANLFDLKGKVALVTGAGSGIGRAMAYALGAAGAKVVLNDLRADALKEAASEVESKAGTDVSTVALDLLDRSALATLAEQASKAFGSPDILVNAAGVNLRQPTSEITWESWDKTLNLNLGVPFFAAQSLVPAMREKGWGKIINIASLQSVRAFANSAPYGASKGGIAQLTRAMAEAWSKDGICANAIGPGFFPTALTAPVYSDSGLVDRLAAQTAIGRNGEMTDLHGITVFLAAPASDYITGQVVFLDGGFTAK
jgi:gluconate 5-dehydrogenase